MTEAELVRAYTPKPYHVRVYYGRALLHRFTTRAKHHESDALTYHELHLLMDDLMARLPQGCTWDLFSDPQEQS